jgi:N-acetylglucosamine-6-sulfatase
VAHRYPGALTHAVRSPVTVLRRLHIRTRPRLAAALVAVLAIGAAIAGAPAFGARGEDGRPNIVFVLTDDQEWASMKVMPTVRRELRRKGVTMKRLYAQFPLCCPARATLLTGQYAHNHGVLSNKAPDGGFGVFHDRHNGNSLNDWLQAAGYRTGYIGKFLNQYAIPDEYGGVPTTVPAGWDDWRVLAPSKAQYFDYTLNQNGSLRDYGEEEADYSTDRFTDKARRFIRTSKRRDRPFFLMLAYAAPHSGGAGVPGRACSRAALPAPRHQGTLKKREHGNRKKFRFPPSFNEAQIFDKPTPIADQPRLSGGRISAIKRKRLCAWESLLAVDEGVGEVLTQLRRKQLLRDTYIVYTSDNGILRGEHRLPDQKRLLYEESARVPLVVRGPGIPRGAVSRDVVANADITATILDLTGVSPGLTQDGTTLLPSLKNPDLEHGRAILLEAYAGIPVTGVRTSRYLYTEWDTGGTAPELELYDTLADPYQMRNLAHEPAYAGVLSALAAQRDALIDCDGQECYLAPSGAVTVTGKGKGRGCLREPVVARFTSPQESQVVKVSFGVGARTRRDAATPFEATLDYAQLRRALPKPGKVVARATFADGRRLAVSARAKACPKR